jgi:hypothetical protein
VSNDYYGYVPGSVDRLERASWIQRHMGDDIRHYPDRSQGHTYEQTPEPQTTGSGDGFSRQVMQNSIEMVYKRIHGQSYTMVQDAANGWRDISEYLKDLSEQIRAQSDELRAGGGSGDPGWSSAGADAFMARGPGATMMSIDKWAEAANVNYEGLSALATNIAIHHGKMKELWDDYKKAIVARAQQFFFDEQGSYYYDNPPQDVDDPSDVDVEAWQRALDQESLYITQDQYVDALRQEEYLWTSRAQQIEYEMGQGYWRVMRNELNGGSSTVFEGPDNAVVPAGMPGMDRRRLLAAQDLAANLANIGTVPAIDTSALPDLANDAQLGTLDALADQLPAVDETQLLPAGQAGAAPTVPDLQVPAVDTAPQLGLPPGVNPSELELPSNANAPGFLPLAPPPGLAPALGDVPVVPGLPTTGAGGLTNTAFPSSGSLAGPGALSNGILGGAKGPAAAAPSLPPPPPAVKSGKVLGKQPKSPDAPEGLPPQPGAPAALPPPLAGHGRPGQGQPGQRGGRPPQDPTLTPLAGPPPATTAPVLGAPHSAGPPAMPGLPAAARPGPAKPGTAPPVLGARTGRGGASTVSGPPGAAAPPPQAPGRGRPTGPDRRDRHADAPLEIAHLLPTSGELGATSPLLRRPGQTPQPVPRDVGEVPRSLRAHQPVIDSPAELAARRRAAQAIQEAQERERLEDNYQHIKAFMGGEEAWTVQTPGGPVIGGAEKPPAPRTEPRPSL